MSPADIRRFWSKVERGDGCWLWRPKAGNAGYGRLYVGGVQVLAHRISWTIAHGPIPDGTLVCHTCDVRACVRPDHLFLGTPLDNMRDMIAKGRARHEGNPFGSRHGMARLVEADVVEMRRLYESGVTQVGLAERFRISQQVVSKVVRRLAWRHVA